LCLVLPLKLVYIACYFNEEALSMIGKCNFSSIFI